MAEAYVIDAVRTAVGKRNGSLAGVHPIDLGAHTAAPSDLPAPPSCRLRLALVSRWTT